MGCQRAIAEQVLDSGAHYALAVKDNQPTLCASIGAFFHDARRDKRPLDDPAPTLEKAREADAGHGRVEERTCWLSRDLSWIENRGDWKGLAAIALCRSRSVKRAWWRGQRRRSSLGSEWPPPLLKAFS